MVRSCLTIALASSESECTAALTRRASHSFCFVSFVFHNSLIPAPPSSNHVTPHLSPTATMGGTKQIQKTKTTQATTQTAITQAQSLTIVQTLLHGGLSNLAYYRELFSERVFDIQPYDAGRIPSYEEYAEGRLGPSAKDGKKPRTQVVNMAVLRRGRSGRLDKLLEHLVSLEFAGLESN